MDEVPSTGVVIFSYDSSSGQYGPPVAAGADDPPPIVVEEWASTGVNGTSIDIHWSAGDFGNGGTTRWRLWWQKGGRAPAGDTEPMAELPVERTSLRVAGLARNTPYTFVLRAADGDGHVSRLSRPYTTTTRLPGLFVSDNAGPDNRWTANRIGGTGITNGFDVDFSRTRDQVRAVFVTDGAHYAEKPAGTRWPDPERLSDEFYAPGGSRVRLSAGSRGWRAVGWNELGTCRLRVRTPDASWGPVTEPMRGCQLTALVVTGSGDLHLLVNTPRGSIYRTNAAGEWRAQRLGGWAMDSMLTRDRRTGRLIAVVTDNDAIGDAGVVSVTTKPRTWQRFGPLHVVARKALATSVTSFAGTITLTAERGISGGYRPTGAFVAQGRRAALMSPLTRIPGTTDQDRRPRVSAGSRKHVFMAWQRTLKSGFDADKQGIWTAHRRYSSRTGDWRFTHVAHRTRSAFDVPVEVFEDAHGHRYVAFKRRSCDGYHEKCWPETQDEHG